MILLFVTASVLPLHAKRKDDVVVMKNGDRFTGEIKGLSRGELSFKSSYMSASVRLDWNAVERIESKDAFIVTLTDGRRVSGLIDTRNNARTAEGALHISEGTFAATALHSDVVGIEQAEKNVLHQFVGSVDLGFSFASGNQSADYFTSLGLDYRAARNTFSLDASSDFNHNEAESTARHALRLQHQRMLNERWFTAELADFLHSEQQELSLRSTFGGGLGRKLYRTEHTYLSAIGGAVYTHEDYSSLFGGIPERSNAEAMLALQFSAFRFRTLNISSAATFFPSMSDPGRYRVGAEGDLKIELVNNLYWKFRVYENFDNKPPVNAPRNDVGVSSSLGWSF
jgi:putative salt-induced outer membrane protein YdiY